MSVRELSFSHHVCQLKYANRWVQKDKCSFCEHFDQLNVSKEKKRLIFAETKRWKEFSYQELMATVIDEDSIDETDASLREIEDKDASENEDSDGEQT